MALARVHKIHGHFHYVREHEEPLTVPSRLRKHGLEVLVGDVVEYRPDNSTVIGVSERRSLLLRPRVANADMAIVVVSACDPLPDLEHTDRVLAQAGLSLPEPPLLCITKPDLVEISSSLAAYRDLYEVHVVCNLTRQGLGSLRKSLAGKIAVLAGKSGVGKSSLLNALCPGLTLKVGELSDKSQAGTHTTRHSQLHTPLPEVGIFDTPGFSSLDMRCSARELASARAFPEVAAAPEACRFRDCLHRGEPGCAVKFRDTRYQSYLTLLREALERQDANLPPNQEDGYQGSQQLASKYRQLSRRRQKQSPPTSESEEGSDASDVRD